VAWGMQLSLERHLFKIDIKPWNYEWEVFFQKGTGCCQEGGRLTRMIYSKRSAAGSDWRYAMV